MCGDTYTGRQIQEIVIFLENLHHIDKALIPQNVPHLHFIRFTFHGQVSNEQTHIAGQKCVLHVVSSFLQHCK